MSRFATVMEAANAAATEHDAHHQAAEAQRLERNAQLADAARLKIDGRRSRQPEQPTYRIHPSAFAAALREWRRARGLTQQGAAGVFGLNYRQYETHETRGQNPDPRIQIPAAG